VFVQLEMGRYQSKQTACHVEQLLRAAVSSDGEVKVDEAGLAVEVDVTVLQIALEEALSNARKVSSPCRALAESLGAHKDMRPVPH